MLDDLRDYGLIWQRKVITRTDRPRTLLTMYDSLQCGGSAPHALRPH